MTKESAANWRNLESKREHSIRRDEAKKKELIKATENSRKSYDEFDGSDGVVFIVYGVRDGEQISKEEYPVDFSTKMNILARGNRHSGKLETGIPNAGNQLSSAYVIFACINGICQALAAQAVRSRLD